jgi:hypothetical protein
MLIGGPATAATAVTLSFSGLLTAVRAVVAAVLILRIRRWAPTGTIAATTISPAAAAVATAAAVFRAAFFFFVVLLSIGL